MQSLKNSETKFPANRSRCRASARRFKKRGAYLGIGNLGKSQGFSLVEVLFALAVVSCGLLSIMGLMAGGIISSKNSATNQAMANISRNLRADLQATPFTSWSIGTATNFYFTYDGYPTTQTATDPNTPYYTAVLTPGAPGYPANGTSTNAYTVMATVSYPYPVNAQATTNSYFVAE